jgi:hypothetical protein
LASIVERRLKFGRGTQDQLWPVAAAPMLGSMVSTSTKLKNSGRINSARRSRPEEVALCEGQEI